MFNLTRVSPMDGIGDFVEYWRRPTPYRWRILALSVALTFAMIVVLTPKTERAPPAEPNVVWINSWPENRSEKEILATNLANQKRKEAAEAVEKQKEEARKNFYRNLARATGMDPDELAREYSRQAANEAAIQAQARAAAQAKQAAQPAGSRTQ